VDDIEREIEEQKTRLDALRPLAPALIPSLREYYDIELTYTSNAIEGNTLTHRETAEVIQHGITVGGKRLSEHLEATDHYEALRWMREIAESGRPLSEEIVTELHRRVVLHSCPEIAGRYSTLPRRVAGSAVIFPNPIKIPKLMADLGVTLASMLSNPRSAFDAHYRLVSIHPFEDGNGRTARLLMNLILIRGGYPPIAVGPADRKEYLNALEEGQLTDDLSAFRSLMNKRLVETMTEYLDHFQKTLEAQRESERARFDSDRGLGR